MKDNAALRKKSRYSIVSVGVYSYIVNDVISPSILCHEEYFGKRGALCRQVKFTWQGISVSRGVFCLYRKINSEYIGL